MNAARPARLGLVGAGRWGQNIIRTVADMPDALLHRLASRNPLATSYVSQDCIIATDWRVLVDAIDLDGLLVATPPDTHADICLAAIDKRLPVFVEKPLTLDASEAQRIAEESEKSGVPILVDHTHLFHESYEMLKSRAERLGGVRAVRSRGGNRGPFRSFPPIYDWGAHDVALILDLCGTDAKLVHAHQLKAERHAGGEGAVYEIVLEFPSGCRGTAVFGNLFARKERRLEADCPDGTLVMDDLADEPLMFRQNAKEMRLRAARSQPLRRALDIFVKGLQGNTDPPFGARLGQRVVELLAEAERLIAARKMVAV